MPSRITSLAAQGSITIRRLRNGDTFYITFTYGDNPLYQGVNPDTGDVEPDWTVPANQPIVTPHVSTLRNASVHLGDHAWAYNGNPLIFNGASSGGWTLDSTGKFALNPTTGALKIVANLASTINTANDMLEYSCTATVDGVEYSLSKTVEIIIQNLGNSSYFGWIVASLQELTKDADNATLTAHLMRAGHGELQPTAFYCKWYKDSDLMQAGGNTLNVTRADVNGSQVFFCEFWPDAATAAAAETAGNENGLLYRASISLVDKDDEFIIIPKITSANTSVNANNGVTVQGQVIRMKSPETPYSLSGATNVVWKTVVMGKRTDNSWIKIREVASDTVTITTADTDYVDENTGKTVLNDVDVIQEVEWEETV